MELAGEELAVFTLAVLLADKTVALALGEAGLAGAGEIEEALREGTFEAMALAAQLPGGHGAAAVRIGVTDAVRVRLAH